MSVLEFGDVGVRGGPVDSEESAMVATDSWASQMGGHADLVRCHDCWPAQFLTSGAGGFETLWSATTSVAD